MHIKIGYWTNRQMNSYTDSPDDILEKYIGISYNRFSVTISWRTMKPIDYDNPDRDFCYTYWTGKYDAKA